MPAKEFGPSWRIYSPENKNKSEFMNLLLVFKLVMLTYLFWIIKISFKLRLYDSTLYFNYSDESAELKISSKIENENTLNSSENLVFNL